MVYRATRLYSAIVSSSDNLAFVYKYAADGDAAFAQAFSCFSDGFIKKGVPTHISPVSVLPANQPTTGLASISRASSHLNGPSDISFM
jgi:hypothetical protein